MAGGTQLGERTEDGDRDPRSSSLPHLANIAYRTGRQLQFDGKSETFVNDKDADKYLTREYRKGWELKPLARTE